MRESKYPQQAFICLGSNWSNAKAQLAEARNRLAHLQDAVIEAASNIYRTEPQNYRNQPWFFNQALAMRTVGHKPASFMHELLQIEEQMGRVRNGPRFGPRLIDIDLLWFDDQKSCDPVCILPHPRLTERAFALLPLSEIAPQLLINGKKAGQWLAELTWRKEEDKIYQS